MAQPIIRGIQAVGAVTIKYFYNSTNGILPIPTSVMRIANSTELKEINTENGIEIAGFRLDGEFLRAVQQIASSVVIPILGGGGVALTNNNRTGTLNITATRVSTPSDNTKNTITGAMHKDTKGIGPKSAGEVYDLTFIAQIQQAQEGGDSVGARIQVGFDFCGKSTTIEFQGCTIASVDPIGLAGNDAANYNISINYLNWTANYSDAAGVLNAVT